jgi:hypothetical protein
MSKIRIRQTGNADIDKAFEEVIDYINDLIKSVNTPATETTPNTSGKTGDIRVLDAGSEQKLQIRTKDGWANLVDSNDNDITTKIG